MIVFTGFIPWAYIDAHIAIKTLKEAYEPELITSSFHGNGGREGCACSGFRGSTYFKFKPLTLTLMQGIILTNISFAKTN